MNSLHPSLAKHRTSQIRSALLLKLPPCHRSPTVHYFFFYHAIPVTPQAFFSHHHLSPVPPPLTWLSKHSTQRGISAFIPSTLTPPHTIPRAQTSTQELHSTLCNIPYLPLPRRANKQTRIDTLPPTINTFTHNTHPFQRPSPVLDHCINLSPRPGSPDSLKVLPFVLLSERSLPADAGGQPGRKAPCCASPRFRTHESVEGGKDGIVQRAHGNDPITCSGSLGSSK